MPLSFLEIPGPSSPPVDHRAGEDIGRETTLMAPPSTRPIAPSPDGEINEVLLSTDESQVTDKPCQQCKSRRVKCDRLWPCCTRCSKRREDCTYGEVAVTKTPVWFSIKGSRARDIEQKIRGRRPKQDANSRDIWASILSIESQMADLNKSAHSEWNLAKPALTASLTRHLIDASLTSCCFHLPAFHIFHDRIQYFKDQISELDVGSQAIVNILASLGARASLHSALLGVSGPDVAAGTASRELLLSAGARRENACRVITDRAVALCSRLDIAQRPAVLNVEILSALTQMLMFHEVRPARTRFFLRCALGLFRDLQYSKTLPASESAALRSRVGPALYESDARTAAYSGMPPLIKANELDLHFHGTHVQRHVREKRALAAVFDQYLLPGAPRLTMAALSEMLEYLTFAVSNVQRSTASVIAADRWDETLQIWKQIDYIHEQIRRLHSFLVKVDYVPEGTCETHEVEIDALICVRFDTRLVDLVNLIYEAMRRQQERVGAETSEHGRGGSATLEEIIDEKPNSSAFPNTSAAPMYAASAYAAGAPAPVYPSGGPTASYASSAPAPAYVSGAPAPAFVSSAPAPAYVSSAPGPSYVSGAPLPAYAPAPVAPVYAPGRAAYMYTSSESAHAPVSTPLAAPPSAPTGATHTTAPLVDSSFLLPLGPTAGASLPYSFPVLFEIATRRVRKCLRLLAFYSMVFVNSRDKHMVFHLFTQLEILPNWTQIIVQKYGEPGGPTAIEFQVTEQELAWFVRGLELACYYISFAEKRLEEIREGRKARAGFKRDPTIVEQRDLFNEMYHDSTQNFILPTYNAQEDGPPPNVLPIVTESTELIGNASVGFKSAENGYGRKKRAAPDSSGSAKRPTLSSQGIGTNTGPSTGASTGASTLGPATPVLVKHEEMSFNPQRSPLLFSTTLDPSTELESPHTLDRSTSVNTLFSAKDVGLQLSDWTSSFNIPTSEDFFGSTSSIPLWSPSAESADSLTAPWVHNSYAAAPAPAEGSLADDFDTLQVPSPFALEFADAEP